MIEQPRLIVAGVHSDRVQEDFEISRPCRHVVAWHFQPGEVSPVESGTSLVTAHVEDGAQPVLVAVAYAVGLVLVQVSVFDDLMNQP